MNFSKNDFLFRLFHPITLALLVSLVSAWFIFPQFEPYTIELLDQINIRPKVKRKNYFNDIDNDGTSECIRIVNAFDTDPPYILIKLKGRIGSLDQFNYRGNWLNNNQLNFGDFNNNKHNEFYVFNRVGDSLFLNINEALVKNGFVQDNIYLGKAGAYNKQEYDIELIGFKTTDVNQDGYKDLLFVLYARYSKQPRNFYVYDIFNDSLQVSPLSGTGLYSDIQFKDINGDNFPEVLGFSSSPYNFHTSIPYPDSSTWLMVYTKNTEFLFPPIEFKQKYSTLKSSFVMYNGQNYILSILQGLNKEQSEKNLMAFLFNTKGELIRRKNIPDIAKNNTLTFLSQNNSEENPLVFENNGRIYKFDFNLNLKLIRQLRLNKGERLGLVTNGNLDLNQNGKPEFLARLQDFQMCIISDDFKHLTRINEKSYYSILNTSLAYSNGRQTSFGINAENMFYMLVAPSCINPFPLEEKGSIA